MKIYDISQEVFSCTVFPGDPSPRGEALSSMENGALYNLTALHMCAHNGTHVDAPYHFINKGETIERVPLEKFVGTCYVAEHEGVVTAENAKKMLQKAEAAGKKCNLTYGNTDASRRLLIKGKAEVSAEAARIFAEAGVLLVGNESQTVGPEHAPMEVHLILLGAGVVLLEGVRLSEVPEGVYLLNAAPLNLAGADGAPCRAILMSLEEI